MKDIQLINLLEKIVSDENTQLSPEEDIQLKEAFAQIPLKDERLEEQDLNEMEEHLFGKFIAFEAPKRMFTLRRYLSVAAMITFVVGCGLWIKSQDVTYTTGSGQRLSLVLPDESVVKLNKNSTVEYNRLFFFFNRNVRMKGEAYYQVAKGKKFTVETSTHQITVLGTRFVVSASDKFEVICYEGKVAVESLDKKEKKMLTKGMCFSSDKRTLEDEPGWVNQKYTFSHALLIDVIEALEKEYGIKVVNKSQCHGLFFTGSFPIRNLKLALDIVLLPYDLSWKEEAPGRFWIVNDETTK